MGIDGSGRKDILVFECGGSGESAVLWEKVLRDMSRRGAKDVLLFVGDGLSGFANVVGKVYLGSRFQYCVLHAVKRTLMKVQVRDRGYGECGIEEDLS